MTRAFLSKPMHIFAIFSAATMLVLLAGCGLQTPVMQSVFRPQDTDEIVVDIITHIKKELMCTAYALDRNGNNGIGMSGKVVKSLPWIDKAIAKVTLTLTVEDKSTLSPSLTDTVQQFSIALAGSGYADATRKIQSDYIFSFKNDLLHDSKLLDNSCNPVTGAINRNSILWSTGLMVDGDLRLGDTFVGLLKPKIIASEPGLLFSKPSAAAPDVLQSDVTFVVSATGSVAPVWKLTPVSYQSGSNPLFSAMRNSTDEVLVTIGTDKDSVTTAHNIGKANSAIVQAVSGR